MGSDNILQDVSNAVTSLGSLGIQCPEYIVKLFLDEGQDPLQEIPKIYRAITSAGHDCVAFFETVVTGCQQYGSPRAYLWHLARQAYDQIFPHLEDMVKGWGTSARPPVDMITEIDALLARYPGFGSTQGSQGAMASAFMGQYTTIKGNIQRAAVPMVVPIIEPLIQWTATYGPGLSDIWNKFASGVEERITSEWKDGSLGWRLDLVALCIAMILFADEVIAVLVAAATVFTDGVGGVVVIPVGAGVMAAWDIGWICIIMWILNILDLFINMLVSIVSLLTSLPNTTTIPNNGPGGTNVDQASASNLPIDPSKVIPGGRMYIPPKWSHGKPARYRGGFVDAQGNIWYWAPGNAQHGGPHWDVEHPDGSHTNVAPDGKVTHGDDNFPSNSNLKK